MTLLMMLGLCGLLFIAVLTVDGVRARLRRRRQTLARRPMTLVVRHRQTVDERLVLLQLAEPHGRTLPMFLAGQHLVLQAPAGPQGRTVQRAYALAAWQARPQVYELGIRREPQGQMSAWVWDHLLPGAHILLVPPEGHFTVAPELTTLVLVAGGIGITPLRAMVHQALAANHSTVLFQAAHHQAGLLYQAEFEALATQHAHFTYVPVLSRPAPAWHGLTGHLSARRIRAVMPRTTGAHYYLCAPSDMMAMLRRDLTALGVPASDIHHQSFSADGSTDAVGLHTS